MDRVKNGDAVLDNGQMKRRPVSARDLALVAAITIRCRSSADQARFRTEMLGFVKIDEAEWVRYWEQLKAYRDNLIAHHIENNDVTHYPVLDTALRSSYFYYRYLIRELRALGESGCSEDLERYANDFETQCKEVAKLAIVATGAVKEQVFSHEA